MSSDYSAKSETLAVRHLFLTCELSQQVIWPWVQQTSGAPPSALSHSYRPERLLDAAPAGHAPNLDPPREGYPLAQTISADIDISAVKCDPVCLDEQGHQLIPVRSFANDLEGASLWFGCWILWPASSTSKTFM